MLRVCCAASQRRCAVIVRPDTDPSWEAPAPWLPRRLPSGCTGQAVEVPRVLAWGDVKKSPCSPWSKLLQTPGLLRGFMQPKGVINLGGGDWACPERFRGGHASGAGGRVSGRSPSPACGSAGAGLERCSPANRAGKRSLFWERAPQVPETSFYAV